MKLAKVAREALKYWKSVEGCDDWALRKAGMAACRSHTYIIFNLTQSHYPISTQKTHLDKVVCLLECKSEGYMEGQQKGE